MRKGLMIQKPLYYTTESGDKVKLFAGKISNANELAFVDSGIPQIGFNCGQTQQLNLESSDLNMLIKNGSRYRITYRAYWHYNTSTLEHSYQDKYAYAIAKNNKLIISAEKLCLVITYISTTHITTQAQIQDWSKVSILKVEEFVEPTSPTAVKITSPNKIVKRALGNLFTTKTYSLDTNSIKRVAPNLWISYEYGNPQYTTSLKDFNFISYNNTNLYNAPDNQEGIFRWRHYESTDGINWDKSLYATYNEIQYVGNRYFMLFSNRIETKKYSTGNRLEKGDTSSWTSSYLTNINKVTYANGLYVATGSVYRSTDPFSGYVYTGTGIAYSTDGTSWTNPNITQHTCHWITYANGVWLACFGQVQNYICTWPGCLVMHGDVTSKELYYSTDGKTWNLCNYTRYLNTSTSQEAIEYRGYHYNKFWIYDTNNYSIHCSTDGINWDPVLSTEVDSNGKGLYSEFICIDDLLIIPKRNSKNYYYSSDGENWYESTSNTIPTSNGLWPDYGVNCITYCDNVLSVSGTLCQTLKQTIPGYMEVK